MKKKYGLAVITALMVIFPMLTTVALAADPVWGNTQFRNLWIQQDRLVGVPGIDRPYTWGPSVPEAPNVLNETYAQSPGGQRQVQYFDKARMELNNPATGFVTAGLVVRDLVLGFLQNGDNDGDIQKGLPSSQTQVSGDAISVNPNTPTYASFKSVVTTGAPDGNSKPSAIGAVINASINQAGTVGTIAPPESLTVGAFQTETGHNIAKVFEDFKNQKGSITDPVSNATITNQPIYTDNPTIRVFGYAISEPYWVNTKISGVDRVILVQLFQRRVLTYNPAISGANKVEMGNVGQHYYRWRYIELGGGTPPPPPPAATPPLDYTQFRASYNKTGSVPLGGTGNRLNYSTGAAAIQSSPVYDNDKKVAIIATNGAGIVGVNISNFDTPTQAWKFQPTAVNFPNPVTVYNGVAYVAGADGKVYAVKTSDGTSAWTSPSSISGASVAGQITVDTDSIYFTAANGKIYSRNLSDGSPKWENAITGVTLTNSFAPVLLSDGTLYVAGNDKKLYAFKKDGTLVSSANWTPVLLDGAIQASPAYSNGKFYVATLNGTLYALNANGTIQTSKGLGAAIYTMPAIATVGTGTRVYVGTDGGKVYGVDAADVTNLLWTFDAGATQIRSSAAIVDGFVYFGAQNGRVYKVEAANSANSTSLITGIPALNTNSPLVNSGYLIIAGSGGILHVVR